MYYELDLVDNCNLAGFFGAPSPTCKLLLWCFCIICSLKEPYACLKADAFSVLVFNTVIGIFKAYN